ncbi:MAG: MMPL family transporter [Thermomicrobiales bacterium]
MSSLSFTARLARFSAHNRWKVVIAWVVALVIFGALQGAFPLNTTTGVELLNNPESQQGWDALEEHGIQDERHGTETVVIQSTSTTVDDPAFQSVVQSTTDALRASTEVVAGATNYYELGAQNPDAAASLVSSDRKTTIIPVTLAGSLEDASHNGDEILDIIHGQQDANPDYLILTGGDASTTEEINTIVEKDIQQGESIGVTLALVILLVVFGAFMPPFKPLRSLGLGIIGAFPPALVPILLAAIAIVIAFGLAAVLSQAFELSFFVTNMITMIGLAVGIDYSLFTVDRFREERRRGLSKLDAVQASGATASRAVFFSGLTVIFALAGMFIVPNNIYRSLSIGAIFVVAVAVLATLTFIPAVIAILGNALDWPRSRKYGEETIAQQEAYDRETIHKGFWGTITRTIMARPVISLVIAVAFLLLCAYPYLNFEPGLGGISTLPDEMEGKQAFEILQSEFSAGLIQPVEIVVEGPQDDPSVQQGITDLQASLAAATTDDGQPLFGAPTVTPAPDGQAALISIPMTVAPDSAAANEAIHTLRDDIVPPIEESMADTNIMVTGITANNVDFLEMRDTYTPIVFTFVLGLSFLLLLVVFRSIVIAIKAILMNLLSVGAAYGLLIWVFQEGHLAGLFGFDTVEVVEAWIPLFLFSVLFGLSMDYHVFLLSRIREHYDYTQRNAESVAVGLQRTGRIITGAALIMVSVFFGFASGRLSFLQEFGFGLGVAVLLDATIVRCVLVPSAMALLGDWNWYLPKWLNWLPNVHVEGPGLEPAYTEPEPSPAD